METTLTGDLGIAYTCTTKQTASNARTGGLITLAAGSAIPRADADHQPVGTPRVRSEGIDMSVHRAPQNPAELSSTRPDLKVLDGGTPHRQLALDLEWEVAPGIDAVPGVPAHLRLVTPGDDSALIPPGLPDAGRWVAQLARAVAEVHTGERPAAQLTRWVSRSELMRLTARAAAYARHPATRAQRASGGTPTRAVRAVRVCPVAPGIVEASAVLVGRNRSQAIAIRLEATGGRWLATAVDLR